MPLSSRLVLLSVCLGHNLTLRHGIGGRTCFAEPRAEFQTTVELRWHEETSHFFTIPPALRFGGQSLLERHLNWKNETEKKRNVLSAGQKRINEIAFNVYGISESDITMSGEGIETTDDASDDTESGCEDGGGKSLVDVRASESETLDATGFARGFVSYLAGSVLGVWDIQHVFEKSRSAIPTVPTDPLPQLSPGALRLRSSDAGNRHQAGVKDGILVDDQEHANDIVRRVRDALELLFKEDAEKIEHESSQMLGVRDQEYFRNPSKGGFWDDHISRYSDSRRNAPIYWLLQSSKRNYAIWLHYHRLNKDLLFKALVNYVEPKIRLATSHLETLRSKKAAAGDAAKEAKRIANEVEWQEEFLSELRDFEDKLRRVANLHLEPDLNDGVVLNIASLHELVPWKEAKGYWEELLAGKYEWSYIGKQLRQKGLVK